MNKIKNKYKIHYLNNKVELIYRTSIFEGLTTTRLETSKIMAGGRGIGASYEDAQIVLNIYHTWERLIREEFKGTDKEVLEDLNKNLKHGLEDSHLTGKVRTHNVKISGTTYRPPSYRKYNLEDLLQNLFKVLGQESIDSILYVYIHLMRTQFFVDGNKRTAYMFTNWVLMSKDLGYILYLPSETSEKEFLRRLREFYENPRKYEMGFIKYIKQYYLKKV